jgi:hypothetical protein
MNFGDMAGVSHANARCISRFIQRPLGCVSVSWNYEGSAQIELPYRVLSPVAPPPDSLTLGANLKAGGATTVKLVRPKCNIPELCLFWTSLNKY